MPYASYAFRKTVPVRVTGPKGHVDTHALLDGSTVMLVDTALATRIGAETHRPAIYRSDSRYEIRRRIAPVTLHIKGSIGLQIKSENNQQSQAHSKNYRKTRFRGLSTLRYEKQIERLLNKGYAEIATTPPTKGERGTYLTLLSYIQRSRGKSESCLTQRPGVEEFHSKTTCCRRATHIRRCLRASLRRCRLQAGQSSTTRGAHTQHWRPPKRAFEISFEPMTRTASSRIELQIGENCAGRVPE
ncbi:hypothetical protein EVAR_64309_1 [Eumeta japonica]|uniref:Uncharacterized protein n=1 Tax=Eumeta variegata TaxID=151549 RepID=A0A4C2ABN7_EUMVA|nr:hypothetical protein EVAR_64309_1 [Eumeta japonica]